MLPAWVPGPVSSGGYLEGNAGGRCGPLCRHISGAAGQALQTSLLDRLRSAAAPVSQMQLRVALPLPISRRVWP
jgi:hypothetical protein